LQLHTLADHFMDLSVLKQSLFLHLKTQNQHKYYQHQNYVKNDTKLSKPYQNQYQNHKDHFKTKLMTKISKYILDLVHT
jgi:hypothetical protein